MQSMSIYGTIDFLKLDIEGQEKYIFEDEKSWPVLCGVRCMAAEVHEKLAPGATRALEDFISVCPPFSAFVTKTWWCNRHTGSKRKPKQAHTKVSNLKSVCNPSSGYTSVWRTGPPFCCDQLPNSLLGELFGCCITRSST